MLHTIVLRFSDYEKYTIPEHQALLNARGYVWWGWWKKKHETWPITALRQVADTCPIEVGLINRDSIHAGNPDYYLGKFTRAIFENDGKDIPSPDPTGTPPYYRDSVHPAWFQCTSITPLDEAGFKLRFGGVPTGDPTLIAVERSFGGGIKLVDAGPYFGSIRTAGDSILHLSDLHLGPMHGFPEQANARSVLVPTLVSAISQYVGTLADCHIGVIVVSGDIITKADPNLFPVAIDFLRDLLQRLKLPVEALVCVPGNHDLPLEESETPTRTYAHEYHYRGFIRALYNREMDLGYTCEFLTPSGWTITVTALNSAHLSTPKRQAMAGVAFHPGIAANRGRVGATSSRANSLVLADMAI
jgi:Calcineurin-like phosphoesterase